MQVQISVRRTLSHPRMTLGSHIPGIYSMLFFDHLHHLFTVTVMTSITREGPDDYFSAVRFLVDNGADINAASRKYSVPAVNMALEREDEMAFWASARQGADLHGADKVGSTALHYAAMAGSLDSVFNYLIQQGLDINAMTTTELLAPLRVAAENLQVGAIRFLLRHGTDVDILDSYEITPAHKVFNGIRIPFMGQQILSTLKILLEHGANVEARDYEGTTLLLRATNLNHKARSREATLPIRGGHQCGTR